MGRKTAQSTNSANPEELSFEQAVASLESIIDRIEKGEIGLEESLSQYEYGVQLIRRCRQVLDRTEQRITELTELSEAKATDTRQDKRRN